MSRIQNAVFVLGQRGNHGASLSSSIDDLSHIFLAPILDRLVKGILDRGIIRLHEVILDELDRQRGFPCDQCPPDRAGDKIPTLRDPSTAIFLDLTLLMTATTPVSPAAKACASGG
jgi:hypothetical protein